MTAPKQSDEAERRLDDLRRHLYRADATAADVERYLAERGDALEAEPEPADEPIAPPPGWSAKRTTVVALVAVAALVVGVQVARPAQEVPTPTRTQALQQVGMRQPAAVDMTDVSGPVEVGTTVRGTPVEGEQFEGTGPAVVPVERASDTFAGGRAMVVLTADKPVPLEWRALRIVTRNDRPSSSFVLAHGTADPGDIVATPSTFVYPGAPPARIAVEVPKGVRWSLIVAVTDRIAPSLH
jgi:hypothetical protein